MSESCATCRFWNGEHGAKFGTEVCRIRAPRAYPQPDPSYVSSVLTVWPETRYNDWCGEYHRGVPIDPPDDPEEGRIHNDGMVWAWLGGKWKWMPELERGEFH